MFLVLSVFCGLVLLSPVAYSQSITEMEGTWFHAGRVAGGPGLLMTVTFKSAKCFIAVNKANAFGYEVIEYNPAEGRFRIRIGAKVTAYLYKVSAHYLILYSDDSVNYPASQERAKVITLLGKSG